MTEKDPTGRDPHESGAKLDAGKPRPALVLGSFSRALQEVVNIGTFGARKYSDNGWLSVPNAQQRYTDAMMRHLLEEFASGEGPADLKDHDSGLLTAAHTAWNALARLELALREKEQEQEESVRADTIPRFVLGPATDTHLRPFQAVTALADHEVVEVATETPELRRHIIQSLTPLATLLHDGGDTTVWQTHPVPDISQMQLSICVALKNRSRVPVEGRVLELFPNCVRSLAKAVCELGITAELVVCDGGSTDWPLEEWLAAAAQPMRVKLIRTEQPFSHGGYLNTALSHAAYENVMAIDACMTCDAAVMALGLRYCTVDQPFLPMLFSYWKPDHSAGWWRDTCFGVIFARTDRAKRVHGWHSYQQWGSDDTEFAGRIGQDGTGYVRFATPGLFHHWHPNDIAWKNKQEHNPPRRVITSMSLFVTRSCQLNCQHCNQGALRGSTVEDMTLAHIDALIAASVKSGYTYKRIVLAGGEPLLWPDIEEAISRLEASRIVNMIELFTNGLRVDEVVQLLGRFKKLVVRVSNYGEVNAEARQLLTERLPNHPRLYQVERTQFIPLPTEETRVPDPVGCACPGFGLVGGRVGSCPMIHELSLRFPHHDYGKLSTELSPGFAERLPPRAGPWCGLCTHSETLFRGGRRVPPNPGTCTPTQAG